MSSYLTDLKKKFGDDKFVTLSEAPKVKVVSTGSVSLDFAVGVGGLPLGRVVEVFGAESVGKTALSYYMIGQHLRAFPDKAAYFINIEGGFDWKWAKALAPNIDDRLVVASPSPGEESVHMAAHMVASGKASIVVYDSVGAMLTEKESQPGEKQQAGGQSRLVTHMAKLTTTPAERTETTFVILNQLRDTFAVQNAFATHSPGGRALRHQAAIRILLKRANQQFKAKVNGEEIEVGFRCSAIVKKNKAGAPNEVAGWNFYNRPLIFNGGTSVTLDPNGTLGIDTKQEIIDLGLNTGVIEQRSGGYYHHSTFPEDNKGENRIRSRDSVVEFLLANPDVQEVIRQDLMEKNQEE